MGCASGFSQLHIDWEFTSYSTYAGSYLFSYYLLAWGQIIIRITLQCVSYLPLPLPDLLTLIILIILIDPEGIDIHHVHTQALPGWY